MAAAAVPATPGGTGARCRSASRGWRARWTSLYPGYFTFSFVRNPCRRCLSPYRHASRYAEIRAPHIPNHPPTNGTLREVRGAALRSPGDSVAPSQVCVRPCPAADALPCRLQWATAVRVEAPQSRAAGFHRRGRIDRSRLPAGAGGARPAPTSARAGVPQGHDSEVPGLNLRDRSVPLPDPREWGGLGPARSRTHPGPWMRSPAGIRSPDGKSPTVRRCRLRRSAYAASPPRITFRCPTDEDSRLNARRGAAPVS